MARPKRLMVRRRFEEIGDNRVFEGVPDVRAIQKPHGEVTNFSTKLGRALGDSSSTKMRTDAPGAGEESGGQPNIRELAGEIGYNLVSDCQNIPAVRIFPELAGAICSCALGAFGLRMSCSWCNYEERDHNILARTVALQRA